jgi:hypothetical protein
MRIVPVDFLRRWCILNCFAIYCLIFLLEEEKIIAEFSDKIFSYGLKLKNENTFIGKLKVVVYIFLIFQSR